MPLDVRLRADGTAPKRPTGGAPRPSVPGKSRSSHGGSSRKDRHYESNNCSIDGARGNPFPNRALAIPFSISVGVAIEKQIGAASQIVEKLLHR